MSRQGRPASNQSLPKSSQYPSQSNSNAATSVPKLQAQSFLLCKNQLTKSKCSRQVFSSQSAPRSQRGVTKLVDSLAAAPTRRTRAHRSHSTEAHTAAVRSVDLPPNKKMAGSQPTSHHHHPFFSSTLLPLCTFQQAASEKLKQSDVRQRWAAKCLSTQLLPSKL